MKEYIKITCIKYFSKFLKDLTLCYALNGHAINYLIRLRYLGCFNSIRINDDLCCVLTCSSIKFYKFFDLVTKHLIVKGVYFLFQPRSLTS